MKIHLCYILFLWYAFLESNGIEIRSGLGKIRKIYIIKIHYSTLKIAMFIFNQDPIEYQCLQNVGGALRISYDPGASKVHTLPWNEYNPFNWLPDHR